MTPAYHGAAQSSSYSADWAVALLLVERVLLLVVQASALGVPAAAGADSVDMDDTDDSDMGSTDALVDFDYSVPLDSRDDVDLE